VQFSQDQTPFQPIEHDRNIKEVELEAKLQELQITAAKKDRKLAKRQNAIDNIY